MGMARLVGGGGGRGRIGEGLARRTWRELYPLVKAVFYGGLQNILSIRHKTILFVTKL